MDYLNIVTRASLPSCAKLVLLYLMHPKFEDTSQKKHASELRMSIRAFSMSIRALEDKGYIRVTPQSKKFGATNFNKYDVLPKAWRLVMPTTPAEIAG